MSLLSSSPREVLPQVPAVFRPDREVPESYLLATDIRDLSRQTHWDSHRHAEHELIWSVRGTVTMFVEGRRWSVTPGVGLWIPGGMVHEGYAQRDTAVRITYFSPEMWSKDWTSPCPVTIHPALRELLVHLKTAQLSERDRQRAQQVCIDMLNVAHTVELDVPLLRDPRVTPLVNTVLYDPADDRPLEQWAVDLNMTSRTLSRVFAAEISMSFTRWRRLVRMREAMALLGDGMNVKQVSRRVGYSTTSAFVAAFRKVTGYTPGNMYDQLGLD
ncbi:helix-turn-helix domain-containing protein [Glutamicibacter sp. NPDC087344]|uniref:helix-turn-helix domain-containing protein n=1 Tax=Glutamicibacter sp. NPDC087344 TaxID=3363994 RepID=UPI00382F9BFC